MEVPRYWRLPKSLVNTELTDGKLSVLESSSARLYGEWKNKFEPQDNGWSEKKLKELCREYGIMWE